MTNPTGGPAFPIPAYEEGTLAGGHPPQLGMTLRDWFAGQALSGILSGNILKVKPDGVLDGETMVKQAFEFADAMIRHRST